MKINSVAILGAGAVGSYIYWGLAHKPEIDVCFIADGERKARLEREGLVINNKDYHPAIKTAEEAKGADILIVTVKYNALTSVLPEIKTAAGGDTFVMSLLNGVDSEEIISEVIPEEKIVYSLIRVGSQRVGNSINFNPYQTTGVVFGEKDASRGHERTDALCELFEGTEVGYRASDNILPEIWTKYLGNVSQNQSQAVVGAGIGALYDSEHAGFIMNKLAEEVIAVAKAQGIDLSLAEEPRLDPDSIPKNAKFSTMQDIEAGRHTEVDMFSGAIVKIGRKYGVPTPFNEYTYHLIKALEEKNDGKFNY